MPFVKVIVDAVWATKDKKPLMSKEKKDALCAHIYENAKTKSIHVLNVNGWRDHLHCLISMSSDQNIATIIGLIKGESSFWANKNLTWNEKFGWQDEYFAVSVSESQLQVVNQYIENQEAHHRQKTFQQEYDEFIKKYDFGE